MKYLIQIYTPGSFNGAWNGAYAGLVPDIDAMNLMATEKESWIHVGAGKILKGYVLQMLVDKHGDIPYTEAWQGTENAQPNFDSQTAVYDVAGGLYDEAIADLNKTAIGTAEEGSMIIFILCHINFIAFIISSSLTV